MCVILLEPYESSLASSHIGLAVLELVETVNAVAVMRRVDIADGAEIGAHRVRNVVQEDVIVTVLA